VIYWIGLGSNLGDRLALLRDAATALASIGTITGRSRVFASNAVGGPPQPSFLNAVAVLDSALEPQALLDELHRIEAACGRKRDAETVRWGPRTLDLDVLLAGARGEVVLKSERLEIPHPRLVERAFALAPLCDLAPTLVHPTAGRPLNALLATASDLGHAVAPTGDML
jgi:2-amino-4-hydroxy-6-hydroxymethyldihydropteridine diphosphokinase